MMHKNEKTSHKCIPHSQERPCCAAKSRGQWWPQSTCLSLKQQVAPGSSLSLWHPISQAMPLDAVQGNAKVAQLTDPAALQMSTRQHPLLSPALES